MTNDVIMSSYKIDKNKLSISVTEGLLSEHKELKIVLTDRETQHQNEYEVTVTRESDAYTIDLNLDQVDFPSTIKSILDVQLIMDHMNTVKLIQPVAKNKDRSIRYHKNSYHIHSKAVAVPYLTLQNSLAILYGDKREVYSSYCTYVNDLVTVENVQVINNKLGFAVSQFDFKQADDIYFEMNKRDSETNVRINHQVDDSNHFLLDLDGVQLDTDSQYDLYLNIKSGRIVHAYRVGTNEAKQALNKIKITNVLSIVPYINGSGQLTLIGMDEWPSGFSEITENLYFDDISIHDGRLTILLSELSRKKINELSDWNLILRNTTSNEQMIIDKNLYKTAPASIEIDLTGMHSSISIDTDVSWSFYILIDNQEKKPTEIYQFIKPNEWLESPINRYQQAFLAEDNMRGIVYITSKNTIGLTFGDQFKIPQIAYNKVSSLINISNLVCKEDGTVQFQLVDMNIQDLKMARVILKERGNIDVWESELETEIDMQNNNLTLYLSDFIDLYQYNVSRWDVYLELTYNNMIVTGKIGCYDEPLLPKHQRYYAPIAVKGNMLFVPYLSIYNELSLVVNDKIAISNEMVSSTISLTDFSMKRSVVKGTTEVEIKDAEHFTVDQVMLKYRGKADEDIEYLFPVIQTKRKEGKLAIQFEVDLAKVELQPFYYDLFIVIKMDGKDYPIKIKNPTKKVKKAIDKKIVRYSYTFSNGYFVYPYISTVNTLAFTYREKPKYESLPYKIKENLAYITYRLFKNHFDQKDIWLSYEKFSEGAQDNGYYFFKYCYENNKKSDFYYIIKKDSVDYENIAPMKDKVVEFMSFKYMIYMYAAKLLISSESKGHAYDIRIQKGRLKRALIKKKHVFLQHGVTALKRVDYVFRKTRENAVDLFVATSDYEHDIIKKYFGYDDDEIITTGFCRWDVLEDKSGEEKEIFVMPTWRTWMDDLPEDQFLESDYYKNYVGFFQSEELSQLLIQNNIKLSFYIHPKFKAYIDTFNVDNPNIKVYQYGEEKVNSLLMKSSMLVTDYSSVAWEMFYQKKPVVFFQFDLEKYNAFQGSYLDMNTELFGDQVFTVPQLIDQIKGYVKRDFNEKEEFGAMREKYFKYVDKNNCERTFDAIMHSKLVDKKDK